MSCPRCGAPTSPEVTFCSACGARIDATDTPGPPPDRPPFVTILALLQWASAAVTLLLTALALVSIAGASSVRSVAVILTFLLAAGGVANLACGIGLWTLKPYGRMLQLVFAWIGLLAVPFGTIASVLVLVYLRRPGMRTLFSGKPAEALSAADRAQIAAANQGGAAFAVIVLLMVAAMAAVVPLFSAIAIPGLLRARVAANEALAKAALMTINTAQLTFAMDCGHGFFAPTLASLATPPPDRQAGFLPADLGRDPAIRSGYEISIVAGEPVADAPPACNGSTVVATYFAAASPERPGTTGILFFGANQDGGLFQSMRAIAPTHMGIPRDATPVVR